MRPELGLIFTSHKIGPIQNHECPELGLVFSAKKYYRKKNMCRRRFFSTCFFFEKFENFRSCPIEPIFSGQLRLTETSTGTPKSSKNLKPFKSYIQITVVQSFFRPISRKKTC